MFAHPALLTAIADAKAIGPRVVLLRGTTTSYEMAQAVATLKGVHDIEVLVLNSDVEVTSLPAPSLGELVADLQKAGRAGSVQDGAAMLTKKYLVIKREG